MKDVDIKAYVDFMYNRDNEHNCSECPENEGFDSWGGRLPCGQQLLGNCSLQFKRTGGVTMGYIIPLLLVYAIPCFIAWLWSWVNGY